MLRATQLIPSDDPMLENNGLAVSARAVDNLTLLYRLAKKEFVPSYAPVASYFNFSRSHCMSQSPSTGLPTQSWLHLRIPGTKSSRDNTDMDEINRRSLQKWSFLQQFFNMKLLSRAHKYHALEFQKKVSIACECAKWNRLVLHHDSRYCHHLVLPHLFANCIKLSSSASCPLG
jgi:hypothetical protein